MQCVLQKFFQVEMTSLIPLLTDMAWLNQPEIWTSVISHSAFNESLVMKKWAFHQLEKLIHQEHLEHLLYPSSVTDVKCLIKKVNNLLFQLFRFVLVNSIALQGDDCSMCSEAMRQLHAVADKLNCYQRSKKEIFEDIVKQDRTFCELPKDSPPPILIQV